jgi:anti-sigma regulatory factor (Ser/Thr protein kinase)
MTDGDRLLIDVDAGDQPPGASDAHVEAAVHHLVAARHALARGSDARHVLDVALGLLEAVRVPRPAGPSDPAHLDRSLPAVPAAAGAVRDLCRQAAAALGASELEQGDVAVAVTEAAANAVRHGYQPGATGTIELQIRSPRAGALEIVITDHGGGLSTATSSPGLGKGLLLMQELSDTFAVSSGPQCGTSVRLGFAFAAQDTPSS